MKPREQRECPKHGRTTFVLEGLKTPRWRCTVCRVEAVTKRRRKLKQMAVQYKGGKCQRCGYDKNIAALDFHHRDPTQKDFGIARNGHTMSWEKMKSELDKCDLVCANCHREIHSELDLDDVS